MQRVLFIGLCVIAYILYSPTFNSIVLHDDALKYFGDSFVSLESVSNIFGSHSRWVVSLWNYITFSASGLSVEAFRVQNFILHLLTASIMLILFNTIFDQIPEESWLFKRGKSISLLAVGLFLLHPAQTQTVLNIMQMLLEVLMVFAALLVVFLMVKAILHCGAFASNAWLFGALFSSVLAVGTKEAILIVPFLVLLIDWFFIARNSFQQLFNRWRLYAVFFMCFYGSFFILNSQFAFWEMITGRLNVFSSPGCLITSSYHQPLSASSYFLTQLPVVLHYISIFIFPFNLCFDYQFSVLTIWVHPVVIFSFMILLVLM